MNVSPHIYVLSTVSTAIATLLLFNKWGVQQEFFLLPILLLALIYAAVNFKRQLQGKSVFNINLNFSWGTILRQALARYLVWLCVIAIGDLFYKLMPYYSSPWFRANHTFFDYLLTSYLLLGLPYFVLTLICKSSRREDYYDPAVRLIHIGKQIGKAFLSDREQTAPFKVLRNPSNKKVLLNILMRAYFIPTMLAQVLSNLVGSVTLYQRVIHEHQVLTVLFFISAMLWLTDIINAALNYCLESRWLENRSRSIDMSFSGWLVCLACYAPINLVTGYVFPFAPNVASGNPQDLILTSAAALTIIKILEIFMLGFQVYSNVSLGPSIVNITLKKLQTKGLYALVRHPGTTSKLLLWLVQAVFYKQFWTMKTLYGYSMWVSIYIMRAFTEERHLMKYTEYQQYMKKVNWRFIPGLF